MDLSTQAPIERHIRLIIRFSVLAGQTEASLDHPPNPLPPLHPSPFLSEQLALFPHMTAVLLLPEIRHESFLLLLLLLRKSRGLPFCGRTTRRLGDKLEPGVLQRLVLTPAAEAGRQAGRQTTSFFGTRTLTLHPSPQIRVLSRPRREVDVVEASVFVLRVGDQRKHIPWKTPAASLLPCRQSS